MDIAILYSLPTKRAEGSSFLETDEDTESSAREVLSALQEKGAAPFLVPIHEDQLDQIRGIRADVVFNLIEWTGKELDISIKAVEALECLGVAFTGAGSHNFAVTSHKIKMKKALDIAHLPTARWQAFETSTEPVRPDFVYPVIVKLAQEHCSIGITRDSVVQHPEAVIQKVNEYIRTFDGPVIVEEFIDGREFQVTLLETRDGLRMLPPAEITFDTKGTDAFLTYQSRWEETHPEYARSHVSLAHLSPALFSSFETMSQSTFRALGFRDYARLDVRLKGATPMILEANSNPGLGDSDAYGMTLSYRADGMTFADFIWEIVGSARRRQHSNARKKHL